MLGFGNAVVDAVVRKAIENVASDPAFAAEIEGLARKHIESYVDAFVESCAKDAVQSAVRAYFGYHGERKSAGGLAADAAVSSRKDEIEAGIQGALEKVLQDESTYTSAVLPHVERQIQRTMEESMVKAMARVAKGGPAKKAVRKKR